MRKVIRKQAGFLSDCGYLTIYIAADSRKADRTNDKNRSRLESSQIESLENQSTKSEAEKTSFIIASHITSHFELH